jgi:hypothetical protein
MVEYRSKTARIPMYPNGVNGFFGIPFGRMALAFGLALGH